MRKVFSSILALGVLLYVGCGPTSGSGVNTSADPAASTGAGNMTDSQGFNLGPAEIAYQSAQQFLSAGKYDEAISHLQDAVSIKPGYLEAWSQLGSAYSNRQSYDKGIEAYLKALELSPGDEGLISAVGYNYLRMENWDKADEYFKMLLEKDPNHYNGNVNLAFIAQRREKPEEAIVYYETALLTNPADATTMGTLSDLYDNLGNKDKKYDYLHRAIAADSTNHEFKKKLAKAYFNDKKYAEAVPLYEELAAIYPETADYHQRLGYSYSQSGREKDAPAELEKAITLNGGDAFTFAILSKIYNDNNSFSKAMEAAQAGLKLNGGQEAILYYQWGWALSKLDNYEEAMVKFQKVVGLNDPNWSASAAKQVTRQEQLIKRREAEKEKAKYE